MRSKEEYMELLRSYFLNKAKAYGVVKMALFGSVVRGEQSDLFMRPGVARRAMPTFG